MFNIISWYWLKARLNKVNNTMLNATRVDSCKEDSGKNNNWPKIENKKINIITSIYIMLLIKTYNIVILTNWAKI